MRDAAKRAVWAERVAAQAASGLSVARFCREQQVAPWQLHYWRRRVAAVPARPAPGGFVEVALGAGDGASSGVRLEVGKVAIVLSRGFDEAVLAAVLRAVAEC